MTTSHNWKKSQLNRSRIYLLVCMYLSIYPFSPMDQTLFRSEVQQPVATWLNHYLCVLFNSYSFAEATFSSPSVAFLLASALKVFCLNSLKRQSQAFFYLEWYTDNATKSLPQPTPRASCLFMPHRSSEGSVSSGCLKAKGFALYCPVLHLSILIWKMLTKGLSIAMETLYPISL